MTPLTIHQALLDAIAVLYGPFLPSSTPADRLRNNAVRHLREQLTIIEAPIAEDTAGVCGECKAELLDVNTHDNYDCPAYDWKDSAEGQYSQIVCRNA